MISAIRSFIFNAYIGVWDITLTILNILTPNLAVGKVVPKNRPGGRGKWPEYIAPRATDSRSACPALNAMANHGILPRDGRAIPFTEMSAKIRDTFNFAPTFCRFVPDVMAGILKKQYGKDTLNLEDINLHNGIEHDASLTREDTALVPNQGPPSAKLCQGLLDSATGKDAEGRAIITIADMSRYSSVRRASARATNPEFTLSRQHKMFGSSNASTLLALFGGRVDDLTPFLLEERIPDGWEPRVRSRFGLTIITFNRTVLRVELGIKEEAPSPAAPTEAAPTEAAIAEPAPATHAEHATSPV